jgi:copper chaperone
MYTFHIPKMTCGGCASKVKKAIQQVDDQAHIDFDLPTKTVKVETDAAAALLIKAMTDAGYQPAPL